MGGLAQEQALGVELEDPVVVRAQVGVDHRGVRAATPGALSRSPCPGHDHHPVADVADDVHVVLDEDDRHAFVAQVLDVLEQASA